MALICSTAGQGLALARGNRLDDTKKQNVRNEAVAGFSKSSALSPRRPGYASLCRGESLGVVRSGSDVRCGHSLPSSPAGYAGTSALRALIYLYPIRLKARASSTLVLKMTVAPASIFDGRTR
jgi:hypothetical protein